MCPSLIRVCFFLEIIYFFSIQFILNELSSSHFPTFEIFVKKSRPWSHWRLITQKIVKIFRLSHNSTKLFWHWISRDESNGTVRFVIRDLENFLGFPKPLWQFIIIKISNFPRLYKIGLVSFMEIVFASVNLMLGF